MAAPTEAQMAAAYAKYLELNAKKRRLKRQRKALSNSERLALNAARRVYRRVNITSTSLTSGEVGRKSRARERLVADGTSLYGDRATNPVGAYGEHMPVDCNSAQGRAFWDSI